MATFKHNKKRNTGLVYEFLVRRLSTAMVEKDKGAYQKTLEILKKYYSEGTILAEERELFDVVKNTRGVTENAARRILAEVQKQAKKMDVKKIDIKKSNLIKDVNYTFGQEFFGEHRIPEYRLLASIQMVIDGCRGDAMLSESVAKIQLEEGLIQYMTTKGDYSVKQPVSKNDIDALVMKMMTKRFEEKYSKSFSASQKQLLEKYIRAQVTGDQSALNKFLDEETVRIGKVLAAASTMKEVIEDPEMAKKLEEARNMYLMPEHYSGKRSWEPTKEQLIEEVMLYQKLVEEINSNE
jgi:hypothetical protein